MRSYEVIYHIQVGEYNQPAQRMEIESYWGDKDLIYRLAIARIVAQIEERKLRDCRGLSIFSVRQTKSEKV
jgi:hypothetical protein